jgi:hypothetical protein
MAGLRGKVLDVVFDKTPHILREGFNTVSGHALSNLVLPLYWYSHGLWLL